MIHFKNIKFLEATEVLIAFSTLIILISIQNKGFRLSDEGYYLQGYVLTQPKETALTSFHTIISNTLGNYATNTDVIRIVRHILILASSIILSWALRSSLKQSILVTIPLIYMASTNSFVFGPQSLSYNSLNQFLLIILTALLFCQINKNKISKRRILFFTISVSVLLSSIFFIKITSIALLVILIPIIIFYSFNIKQSFTILFGLIVLTSLLVLTIDKAYGLNTLFKIKSYINYSLEAQSGHNPTLLINTIKAFILQMRLPFLVTLLVFGFFKILNMFKPVFEPVIFWAPFLFIPILICFIFKNIENSTPYLYLIAPWTGYLLAQISFRDIDKREITTIILSIILFLIIPIAGAFGSDTGILRNSLMYSSTWFLIPILLMNFTGTDGLRRKVYTLSSIILLLTFTYKGIWSSPYRKENLANAKFIINNPHHPSDKLYITQTQKKHLKSLKDALTKYGYQKNDYLFGMGDNIGNIFFLEGIIPGGIPFSVKNLPYYFYTNSLKTPIFKNTTFIIEDWELPQTKEIFEDYGFSLNTYHTEIVLPSSKTRLFIPKIQKNSSKITL